MKVGKWEKGGETDLVTSLDEEGNTETARHSVLMYPIGWNPRSPRTIYVPYHFVAEAYLVKPILNT